MDNTNKTQHSQKFFHVCSIIVFVFSCFIFYALGGSKNANEEKEYISGKGKMNTEMAAIGTNVRIGKDKLENVAISDNLNKKEHEQKQSASSSFSWFNDDNKKTPTSSSRNSQDNMTDEQKLALAQQKAQEIALSSTNTNKRTTPKSSKQSTGEYGNSSYTTSSSAETPEQYKLRRQKELEKMKALQIEQLEKLKNSQSTQTTSKQIAAEKEKEEKSNAETAKVQQKTSSKGFYSIDSNKRVKSENIRAVVHGEHKNMTVGSMIKLRLLDNIKIGDIQIPRNTFIYGRLSFGNGRAQIEIDNINYENEIIPFNGVIYDQDGFKGIYIPDNVISDTKKEAASDVIYGVDVKIPTSTFLGSGINAISGAIQKAVSGSVRDKKISVSTNYLVTIQQK